MKLENSAKQLVRNKQLFEKAVSRAQRALKNEKLNSVIAWAQIGADFAWSRHPGFYTSLPLESLLIEVAHKLDKQPVNLTIDSQTLNKHKNAGKTHFLHVMTEAYKFGGHSLVVAGWIRNTSDTAVHSIVTTAQHSPLPDTLTSSVVATEGWCQSLAALSPNLLDRALLLRQFCRSWADVVVLHVHPFDALPIVALGTEEGPPVILFNHADNAFWLGVSIADIVLDLHKLGQSLTLNRRGVKNSKILPIPLVKPNHTPSYESARKKLGIKNDTTVLLTIGSEFKYAPFAGYDFVSTIVKILKKYPSAMLLAIGPRHEGRWAQASSLVDDRIKAMAVIDWTDLHTFYACADIYVESFPMGSLTALLEAGARGVPVIGLHLKEVPHFSGADDVAFENLNVHASSIEAFTSQLEHMIAEPSSYSQKSMQTKKCIETTHFPPGWNDFLDEIMRSMPSEHRIRSPDISNPQTDCTDTFLADLDATVLSPETAQHTFTGSVLRHAMYLQKMELLKEQTRNFLETLPKTDRMKTLKNSLYYLRESLRTLNRCP